MDLLGELARHGAAGVFVSITTLDAELVGRLEPRTTRPAGRLKAIAALTGGRHPGRRDGRPVDPRPDRARDAGDPQGRGARPVRAGAGYTLVRLPLAVAGLFQDWLEQHYPDRKDKVLERIRAMHGGRLNDSRFGVRMGGEGQRRRDDRAAVPTRPAAERGSTSVPGPSRPQPSAARRSRSGRTAPALRVSSYFRKGDTEK